MSTENLTTMTVDAEFALTESRPAKKYALRQPEMNAMNTARIMRAIANGYDVPDAVDLVLGLTASEEIVNAIYAEMIPIWIDDPTTPIQAR